MAKFYYVCDLSFECSEIPITMGDDKFRHEVPYDGEVLGYHEGARVAGHIQDAGTGAGTATRFQFRVVERARDLFSTEPEFRVDSADVNGRCVLEGGILVTEPKFKAGEHIAMDCDGLPGGSDSHQAVVWLTCGMWREVP